MKKNNLLKIFFLFCVGMGGSSLYAQGLLVEKKDGTQIRVPYELLERVTVYEEDAPVPGGEIPTELSQCVEADVTALMNLAKANPQLGIVEGSNPKDWSNLSISWEKNEEGLYVIRGLEIKAETQLEDLVLNFDAKSESSIFHNLKTIKVASAGVKEFVVIDQPELVEVSINGLGKAPVSAVNVQGGMALQQISIENLPAATEIFLGGDSLLNVTLGDLPSLQEQSNLKFRQYYAETNTKDTKIEKLTLRGNLNKLNGLYLNDLGLQQFALETTLPEVEGISLNKNRLTGSLNLKDMSKLASLYLRNNQLESITVSGCPLLKEFDASTNKNLSALDLDLTALTYLDANETSLTSLDITHLKALKKLSVNNSKLETLTLDGGNAALERLNLAGNQLNSFVLPEGVVEPYQIYLNNNRLTTLDLKHAANLEELYVSNNNLESIVMPDEKEMLGTIECGGNHLTANFLREVESNYTEMSDFLAAPQFILNRVVGRQVDASAEVALGMEPYVVKKVGEGWEEVTDIQHKNGVFTLPEGATYRVICTEDVFSFIIYNMEFSFDAPYLIGEVE